MPRGGPDWGVQPGSPASPILADLAEAAARLGALPSLDRLGQVMIRDTFEAAALHWDSLLAGTGALAQLSVQRHRTGEVSVQLVGGSNGGGYAFLYVPFPPPSLSHLGAEVSFSFQLHADQIALDALLYRGSDLGDYRIRYRPTQQDLRYQDSALNYRTIATGLSLSNDDRVWHSLKLVIDGGHQQYVRVNLDGTVYSLAGIPANVTPSSGVPLFVAQPGIYSQAGFNAYLFVDDIILTQNEP